MSGNYDKQPSRSRTVKLLWPCLSKIVAFTAWDEQKLDLGSIAKAFGLDPSTLKLNGHLISRGVDLIASSVTWRSLLKFFSSKGLSTGEDNVNALIVDGKLCKSGTKRACSPPPDAWTSRSNYTSEPEEVGIRRRLHHQEDFSFFMNKKLKENNYSADHQVSKCNDTGFKRKQLLEDVNLFKKLKINGAFSEPGERGNDCPKIISSSILNCSYTSSIMKRMREER